ncbi:BQ2448_7702 [Microbotryum intermedium]|uniref:histone acetyltransferase n=1 Tax=Microbotryum intermedium TaxID=269621 RepID=A0A238FRT1_9BASI|nr:BQ2448_7702 [Microbotryum intermedium]
MVEPALPPVTLVVPPPRASAQPPSQLQSSSSSSSVARTGSAAAAAAPVVAPRTARARPPKRRRESESASSWTSSRLTPPSQAICTPAPTTSTTRIATEPRQIELVIFSGYEIKTEYASPYPLEEHVSITPANISSTPPTTGPWTWRKGSGVVVRSHSRLNPRHGTTNQAAHLKAPSSVASESNTATTPESTTLTNLNPRSPSPELGLPHAAAATARGTQPTPGTVAPIKTERPTEHNNRSHLDDPTAIPASPSESSDASADEILASLVVASPSFRQPSSASEHGSDTAVVKTETPRETEDRDENAQGIVAESEPALATSSDSEPPTKAVDESTSALPPNPASPPVETAPGLPKRGQAGRFLPKPLHETVRGRRQLARIAAAAASGQGTDSNDPSSSSSTRNRASSSRGTRERSVGATSARGRSSTLATKMETLADPVKRMWVCEGCFKYMFESTTLVKHLKECKYHHPPGKKVYQRGAHTIWEVDGAVEKLWCQNLCLFGKLFIEHKYMFFDLEGFYFYVVTDATPSRDWPLAYFSKEKLSYDDYNLACIVTFPPYRAKGWAALLIELSYEITRRRSSPSGLPGTPERPLSASGLTSYRTYWTGTLVRYLRDCFHRQKGGRRAVQVVEERGRGRTKGKLNGAGGGKESRDWVISFKLSNGGEGASTSTSEQEKSRTTQRRRRSSRGWAGETSRDQIASDTMGRGNAERSKEVLLGEEEEEDEEDDTFPTDLIELARRVHLRPEDVAFALVDSGLAQWRRDPTKTILDASKDKGKTTEEMGEGVMTTMSSTTTTMSSTTTTMGGADSDEVLELCITEELVEQVAREKNVKPRGVLSMTYVLL